MKTPRDPVVQYVIVREDLLLNGLGTILTQGAHASMAPITSQLRQDLDFKLTDTATREWANGTFTKIFLGVWSELELADLATSLKTRGVAFNEIHETRLDGQLTAIGLKPYLKSEASPHLSHLRLAGSTDQVVAYVDQDRFNPARLTYSMDTLRVEPLSNGQRLTLNLDFNHLSKAIGGYYDTWLRFTQESKMGCGDVYVDSIGIPKLDHLKQNDTRFVDFFLGTHYQELLDGVLPKEKASPHVTINSLEGTFYNPQNNTLSIFGSCTA
jgi:peptidyl-tRNA hydrolase